MAAGVKGLFNRMLIPYGNWLFRYRNAVFPLVMIGMFVLFRPKLLGNDLHTDLFLDAAGFLVAAFGQGLRAAVIGYAYIKRGGVDKKIHADTLVTEGFFAHSRNPLYDGNLLILAGLFIIHNNVWVYLLGGAFFVIAYIAIVAAEEDFLLQKFGDQYREYCAGVNRWWPRIRGLRRTANSMIFNWQRVLLKDYASCWTWVVMALLLVTYEVVLQPQFERPPDALWGLGGAAVVATAAMAAVRFLKKQKILRA